MKKTYVALAQNPTISTTVTSLQSLAKNVGQLNGVVTKIHLHDFFINLEIEQGDSSGHPIEVEHNNKAIKTTSFINKPTDQVQKTLLEVIRMAQKQRQLTIEQVLFDDGLEVKFNEKSKSSKENHNHINNVSETRKVLLLLDGPNILNRAYYATSFNPERMMQAPDGRYVNGIHGFLQMLNQYLNKFNPTHIATCFDVGKSWRKTAYPEYKDGRKETPQELKTQFPIIQDILSKIGVSLYSDKEYEADDFIASIKEKFLSEHPDGEVYIISNDQDLLQLVDEHTTVIARKSKEDVHYNLEQFTKDYHGFKPDQIIDLKAIEGDNSDNIKGIPGIGGKGAIKLLQKYNTVENLLENKDSLDPSFNRYRKKLMESGEEAIFCKKLTTLKKDIEISNNELNKMNLNINVNSLIDVCEEFKFAKIKKSIEYGKWDY